MSTNWQDRILNHEEAPPQDAWDNIAKMLDNLDSAEDKKNKQAIVVAINQKKTKIIYWRIAAAACIVAIITTTAIWLNSDKTTSSNNSVVATTITSHNIPEVNPVINNDKKEDVIVEENTSSTTSIPKKDDAVILTVDDTEASNKLEYAKAEVVESFVKNPALNKIEKLANTSGDIPNDISLMTPPNGYVSFTGPNGQEVKVSSKFSNLLGYMDGKEPETEEYLDKIVNEGNFWRNKFKTWRNKMINNSVAPSPSNFMDIIELSKLLSENK